MRRVLQNGLAMAALMGLAGLGLVQADDKDKDEPKFTIKEVMEKAHKDGLLKKVVGGKADADEKKELAELYASLAKNKPPKGDPKAFKKMADTIAAAAKKVAEDDKGNKK